MNRAIHRRLATWAVAACAAATAASVALAVPGASAAQVDSTRSASTVQVPLGHATCAIGVAGPKVVGKTALATGFFTCNEVMAALAIQVSLYEGAHLKGVGSTQGYRKRSISHTAHATCAASGYHVWEAVVIAVAILPPYNYHLTTTRAFRLRC